MSKLTPKQLNDAKALMKKNNEKEIFVVIGGKHMYSKKSNALISVGGDESKIERVTPDDTNLKVSKTEDDDTTGGKGKEAGDETPDDSWKIDELKEYCDTNKIALTGKEKSRKDYLAVIAAAAPAK